VLSLTLPPESGRDMMDGPAQALSGNAELKDFHLGLSG
jgi:hypothetical protein